MQNKKININVIKVLSAIKKDKKIFIAVISCFTVLGLIVALNTPKSYTSSTELAPEASSKNDISDLTNIASMIGMNMQFGNSSDAIYPEIYPDLLKSNEFIVGLFNIPVKSLDGKIKTSYYNYLEKYQKTPFWLKATGFVISKLKGEQKQKQGSKAKIDPSMLTKKQQNIADAIRSNITCEVDQKTSIINISVKDQDPLIARTIADSIKNRLQIYIYDYRTKKARNDLEFTKKLFKEAKQQYDKSRQQYSYYADMNNDLVLESYKSKIEDLENEMQLKYNIYTQVVQQLQLAEAKVQENTPAFTIVQAPAVPNKASSRPRLFTLIMWIIFGIIIAIIIISYRERKEIITFE